MRIFPKYITKGSWLCGLSFLEHDWFLDKINSSLQCTFLGVANVFWVTFESLQFVILFMTKVLMWPFRWHNITAVPWQVQHFTCQTTLYFCAKSALLWAWSIVMWQVLFGDDNEIISVGPAIALSYSCPLHCLIDDLAKEYSRRLVLCWLT